MILGALKILASPPVLINELHYHPDSKKGEEEFIELYNPSDNETDLSLWQFTDGISFTLPRGTILKPGGYLVIARNPGALEKATGFSGALGPWSGKLNNAGERVELSDHLGNARDVLTYLDEGAWDKPADGDGSSLELLNPNLPNEYGVCWKASNKKLGTPGAQNSVYLKDISPVIVKPRHFPSIPKPGQNIAITTIVIDDELSRSRVMLHFRKDGEETYHQVPMLDDGEHEDGIEGDLVYGAVIPGLEDNERLDFFIRAEDSLGNKAVSPRDPEKRKFLCQVSSEKPFFDYPAYRIITTSSDRKELETRDVMSDELLDATFIRNDGKIFYNVGLRYRGFNSRHRKKKSFRVEFSKDNPLDQEKTTALNLQALFPAHQWLALDLFRRVGVPASRGKLVRLSFNETNLEVYLQMERVDGDFLSRNFPNADKGNLFRGVKKGDLEYRGESSEAYKEDYDKRTNKKDPDWGELITLCKIMTQTPDDQYSHVMEKYADIDEWIRFFCTHVLLNNWEGGIYNTSGDDYFLYFNPLNKKSVFIPWDMDTLLMGTQQSAWMTVTPSTKRFLRHPKIAPHFLATMRSIMDNEYSIETMNNKIDSLKTAAAPDDVKKSLKDIVTERHTAINEEIHDTLTIDSIGDKALCRAIRRKGVWRYFRGLKEPSKKRLEWTLPTFDDSSWTTGPAIFGYGDVDDVTYLHGMRDIFLSTYIRTEFNITEPREFENETALLEVNYNDGYVAFLNGTEIARSNMGNPGQFIAFDTPATAPHRVGVYENKELGSIAHLLRPGKNVLTIQCHNADKSDLTFSIDAYLRLTDPARANGKKWTITAGEREFLFKGEFNQWKTNFIEFNGQSAEIDFVRGIWSIKYSLKPGENRVMVRALDKNRKQVQTLEQTFILHFDPVTLTRKLSRDTTWNSPDAPLRISSKIIVPKGITLRVTEGTKVRFSPNAGITGTGDVYLEGTEENPVLLAPEKEKALWRGISLSSPDSSLIARNAHIESGNISLKNSAWGYLKNCKISNLPEQTAILAEDASILFLKGLTIEDVFQPIKILRTEAVIEACSILRAGSHGIIIEQSPTPKSGTKRSSFSRSEKEAVVPEYLFHKKGGTLDRDETWSSGESPYYITGNLVIPKDITLTIREGAYVFLAKDAGFIVHGGLIAQGAPTNPIRFSGWRGKTWGSINIQNANKQVRFVHSRFSLSSQGSMTLRIEDSSAEVDSSVFEQCARCVEVVDNSMFFMKNSMVYNSHCVSQCVHAFEGGTMIVEDCAFYDCLDPVEFTLESLGISRVSRSFFIGGPDDGIDSNYCSPVLEGNIIYGFNDKGISLGLLSKPIVERNLVYDCGIGVAIKQGCQAVLNHNTIADNKTGIHEAGSPDTPQFGGGKGSIKNSIVWNNKKSLELKDESMLSASFSNIQGDLPFPGEGNINKNPGFINRAQSDYRLSSDSLCKGAGEKGTDMGALSFSAQATPVPSPPPVPAFPISIKRCHLKEGKGAGINIEAGVCGIVEECRVEGFPGGIAVSSEADVSLSGNDVTRIKGKK